MHLPKYALEAVNIMQSKGYNIYPVGGCVRNHLMGITPEDYDMTTDAVPKQILSAFEDHITFDAGIKHGTISVVIDRQVIEITTHRIESCYSDNRHPDKVKFAKSIYEDLKRRDFTMNAIAYDPHNDSFIDPYGGREDIVKKAIRCVGDPIKRFTEDGLRILRALRFSSVLGFSIDQETKNAIHSLKHLLEGISKERIYSEFTKLLCGTNAKAVLSEFYDVIAVFIPEILPTVGFEQKNIHHCYDVWEHTLVTLESIEKDPILRWTMLCHDLGKPETFFIDEKGGHFFGHYKNSSFIAKNILKRLKASTEINDTVSMLVYHHDSVIPETEKSVKRFIIKLGEENAKRMLKINLADAMGQSPHQLNERIEHINNLSMILDQVLSSNPCLSKKSLAVNGNDLYEIGIPKSKRMGEIIDKLFSEVVDGELENVKEALLKRALELK